MKNYIVGLLFFLVLGISFYVTILEKTDDSTQYPYKLKLYASKMEGIKVGDEVQVRGVRFGKVHSIEKEKVEAVHTVLPLKFTPEGDDVIALTLVMERPIVLYDNYKFRFKTKTVFSGRHLDLETGEPEEEGVQQKPFRAFFEEKEDEEKQVRDIVPSLKYYEDVFGEANAMLVENRTGIRRIVVNFKSLSEKLGQGHKGTVPRVLNSDEMYSRTEDSINDLAILSREARRYIEGQRELDLIPTTFLMVVVFNLLGVNILSK